MDYNNQFVQTGAQSDIGENLTTNIKNSYRMGAEIEAGWSPLSWLTIEGNAALSRNIIKDFDEMASVDWESSFRKIPLWALYPRLFTISYTQWNAQSPL